MSLAHVRKGDLVVVTKGKEAGKRGKVKRVLQNGRVEVEKVMMIKRHTKPSQKNPQGGIVEREGSIAAANVALWCEKCQKPVRSRTVVKDTGSKVRACVKCGTDFAAAG